MNLLIRILVLTLLTVSACPAMAAPPEPLPMGTPYIYQVGNPYWYQPFSYYPTAYYAYSSPYPFGSTSPVFGLYSWDYGVYYPTTVAVRWYPAFYTSYPVMNSTSAYYPYYNPYYYPYVYQYPPLPGRIFLGYSW
jgi:hypothetical protein